MKVTSIWIAVERPGGSDWSLDEAARWDQFSLSVRYKQKWLRIENSILIFDQTGV